MSDNKAIAETEPTTPAAPDGQTDVSDLGQTLADAKSLSDDVAEWVKLKVQLIEIDLRERVKEELNAILSSVVVLGLLMMAFLLGMIALAHYMSDMLGNNAYGFGAVSVAVAVLALIFGRMRPQWIGGAMYSLVPRRWIKVNKSSDDKASKD
jgi:hypothetical protein